ncbi:hypothetical protein [Lysinibacillus xylanilyticus]|uniref:hypothetical protein n=2 Tax=Lysinibacillus xylanilyticus TaxID=582475 RepID=UPI003D053073
MRKRSDSSKCFLRESEAAAANVFCAKAKRQQQMFSARKRSDSSKLFLEIMPREIDIVLLDTVLPKIEITIQKWY